MSDDAAPQFLIWSNQHGAWWAWGGFGYTADIRAAGRFSHEEATREVEGAGAYGPHAALGVPDEVMVLAPECRWQGGPPEEPETQAMRLGCDWGRRVALPDDREPCTGRATPDVDIRAEALRPPRRVGERPHRPARGGGP